MVRRSNILMSLQKGDRTVKILREHPANVRAYKLPRFVRETHLPLKADELRFLARKRIKK